jgi:hypothetical protein
MREYLTKYYAQLEGATITKFNGWTENDLGGSDFPSFEVSLQDGSKALIEISQDEEGNGGGFIFGLNLPK